MGIKIVEVGPRDGLQNEKAIVSLEDKFQFIKLLQAAGIKEIEAGSFVRPDKIPQLADSDELIRKLKPKNKSIRALVPNQKGLDRARATGIKSVAFFTGASNSFTKANINQTIKESLDNFKALDFKGLHLRVYISTVWGCPYEGKVKESAVFKLVDYFLDQEVDEISLGDTIGVAVPKGVRKIFTRYMNDKETLKKIFFHGHDTYGMALANVWEALECGVTGFDSSAGGLGGCPYAPSSAGNLATEDLVYMLTNTKVKTGIDLQKLCDATEFISKKIGKMPASRVFRAKRGDLFEALSSKS